MSERKHTPGLIADLLAALELCAGLAAHRMTDDEWRQVQATIAKARGES